MEAHNILRPVLHILGFITTGIAIVTAIILFKLLSNFLSMRKTFKGFPESLKDKHWLLGHLPVFRGRTVGPALLQKFVEWAEEFPKFYITWFGPFRVIVTLHHPETVKLLLKTAEPKPVGFGGGYQSVVPWLGEGLLVAGGARWARSRRLLTPAFHFEILKPYIGVYKDCTALLVKNIQHYVDRKESFDVFRLVSLCTLDIILRCAFSYRTDLQEKGGSEHPYVKAVNELSTCVSRRNRTPWMAHDFIFYMTKDGREFANNCQYVHKIADDVIAKRRKTLEDTDLSSQRYLDFLDILLTAKDENGNGLTPLEIRSEVDTFLFEGHDTTASGISWILYSLAEHQEYQKECQKEIEDVLNETQSTEIKWEHLANLPVLTKCIKEGMRLHSPVPMITRRLTKPLNIDGYIIPAGYQVAVNIYLLHHNPAIWGEDHLEFNPERFSEENMASRHPYAFCPFSAGPRNCIGQNFAMNEEKTVLATLLHKFNFTLDSSHDTEKMPAMVMRSKNGIKMYAHAR